MGEKKKFVPLNERILVEPFKPEDKTEGGLYIPEEAKDMSSDGIVVEVYEGCEDISVGDHVVYPKYEGSEITIDRVLYKVMMAEKVFGKFSE